MAGANGSVNGNGNGAPPAASRTVVVGELRRALRSGLRNTRSNVLLLRAAPEWRDEAEFDADVDGGRVRVAVAACPTVLAVLDALAADRADGCHLVVLTPCETREVGDGVLARAMRPEIKPVNRWDLVLDAFGARRLDPALLKRDARWIAEALLDAQPPGGWEPLTGTVLTYATALNRLAATRLGIEDGGDFPVDAPVLLEWTADPAAVARFLALREQERDGLVRWLMDTARPAADVVFRLTGAGTITDAVPFGLVAAALYGAARYGRDDAGGPWGIPGGALTARVRAEERYLGGNAPDPAVMRAFGEAAESLVIRWTDNGHAGLAAAMCERAERMLDGLDGSAVAGESRVLETGLDARLAALAEALSAAMAGSSATASGGSSATAPASVPRTSGGGIPGGGALAMAEDALERVRTHGRMADRGGEVQAAEAAVRLARWLASPEEPPATLADGAVRTLRSWAWADRARAVLFRADTGRVPRLASVYASLWARAAGRRARLDEAFARKLAAWTQGSAGSDGLLLVESVLERVARPVAGQRPPVIIVLDGMSAAVGCELAEEIEDGGLWLEAGRREDGREPALATVPSVTAVSRTSLLTGTLRSGGQEAERAGFAAFWGRRPSRLFHKADLAPEPGHALGSVVRDAIRDPETVVGVVLNTVDDTLAAEKTGGPGHWTVRDVTYLRPLLDEARRASRPVILTADHGHVLQWGPDSGRSQPGGMPAPGTRAPGSGTPESARYRTGTPGPGEITVRGPRVLVPARGNGDADGTRGGSGDTSGKPAGNGGGEVVAAVAEGIHYTPRKAGYHGGAAPAEVVVPVITLFPSASLLPPGWHAYDPPGHAPAWWHARVTRRAQPDAGQWPPGQGAPAQAAPEAKAPGRRKRPPAPAPDRAGEALFDVAEVAPGLAPPPAATLGSRVVASEPMAGQRQFVRRPPEDAGIVALIDALAAAGGRLTLAEAADAAGVPPVRLSGYVALVARLLNVDGYAVLQVTDGGRMVELDERLLRQQFLGA